MSASNLTSGPPGAGWARMTGRCTECHFDWSEASYEILVGRCMQDVATFGEAMAARDPALPVAPGLWSASRYVWHTVDVLRFGTERLWTISVDASFGVPIWDENVMAGVRSYDSLSPVVGLIALDRSRQRLEGRRRRIASGRAHAAPRGRHHRRVRRRATKCARGAAPPLGYRRRTSARPPVAPSVGRADPRFPSARPFPLPGRPPRRLDTASDRSTPRSHAVVAVQMRGMPGPGRAENVRQAVAGATTAAGAFDRVVSA